MNYYAIAKCTHMCPPKEVDLRTRENLVHYYEKTGDKKQKLVKEFARSAAGAERYKPEDLRTPETLQKTVDYLLTQIIMDRSKPYPFKYDYIFDRLRAVRQEIVIQNLGEVTTIKLIEPMIKFLVYSLFLLHNEKITVFDKKICIQHLQECLKKVLSNYEQLDFNTSSKESYNFENRVVIESIYLLLNLGDSEPLHRAIKLNTRLKSSYIFASSLKISMNYFKGSNFLVLRDIRELPHLSAAIASLKVTEVRYRIIRSFAVSYNKLSVPLEFLQRVLFYESTQQKIIEELKNFNLEILEHEKGVFVKFDKSKLMLPTTFLKEGFADNKLSDYHLPDLFLSNL